MTKILFICHGNICRSPMCEFVLKDMVQKRGVGDQFLIESRATSTEEIWNGIGNPVYPPAREELRLHGISCEGKRAQQITKEDYELFDYLLCADTMNIRNTLRIVGGDPKSKIKLLLDYTSTEGRSIADPWYTGDFKATWNDVVEGCEAFLNFLGY